MRSDAIWGQLCEIAPSRNIRWPGKLLVPRTSWNSWFFKHCIGSIFYIPFSYAHNSLRESTASGCYWQRWSRVCLWWHNGHSVWHWLSTGPYNLREVFKNLSGLVINSSKTEGIWIGSSRDKTSKPFVQNGLMNQSKPSVFITHTISKFCTKKMLLRDWTESKNLQTFGLWEVFLSMEK